MLLGLSFTLSTRFGYIDLERAAGRPKDCEAIAELEQLLEPASAGGEGEADVARCRRRGVQGFPVEYAARAMSVFVALLRAVNVGGTGKLPMSELRALCEDAGFERVTTYIQSGNVVFSSRLPGARVQQKLEAALAAKLGKAVGVHLRTPFELAAIVRRNPFEHAAPNRLLVLFLERAPPRNALAAIEIPGREELRLAGREVFIHYPDGMGRSRLKIPFAKTATGRNLNTVVRLLALARELDG